jgi:hypothetical protein
VEVIRGGPVGTAAFTAELAAKLTPELTEKLPGGLAVALEAPEPSRLRKSKLSLKAIRMGSVCCMLVWRTPSESVKAAMVALVATSPPLLADADRAGEPGVRMGESGVNAGVDGVKTVCAQLCVRLKTETTRTTLNLIRDSLILFGARRGKALSPENIHLLNQSPQGGFLYGVFRPFIF